MTDPNKDENQPLVEQAAIEVNKVSSIVNRIGFGKSQWLIGLGICCVSLADGAETIVIAILAYILKDEWALSELELGLLGGIIFVGMGLGYLTSTYFEQKLGRLKSIQLSIAIVLFFGILSGFMPDIWSLSITRLAAGYGIAFGTPPALSLAAEVSPTHVRGSFLLLVELSFGLGQIFTIVMAICLVPELSSDKWRLLVIVVALPLIPSLLLLVLFGYESPVYLSGDRQYENAVETLNKMAESNQKEFLTAEEVDQVYSTIPAFTRNANGRFKLLFDRWHWSLTARLMCLAAVATASYYGLGLVLPFVLDFDESEPEEILYSMLTIYSVQVPVVLCLIFIIEREIFGRINSMIICAGVSAVCTLTCAFIDSWIAMSIVLVGALSIANGGFSIVYVYLTEVYSTELRVVGLGVGNTAARVTTGLATYLFYFLAEESTTAVFLFFAALFVCVGVIVLLLPYETRGVQLDSKMH